jgi:hypothetical protein
MGDVWFCSRSCLKVEVREAQRCHTSNLQWQWLGFKNSRFETFCHDLGIEHLFSSPYTPPRMAWWEGKTEPYVRWLRRCSMSIGL